MHDQPTRTTRRLFLALAGAGVGVLGGCGGTGKAEYPQDYPISDRQETDGGAAGPPACPPAGGRVLVGAHGQSVALFQAVGVAGSGRIFLCRDGQGLFGVDATCTHAGCLTSYDADSTTWQCPCHGSVFGYDCEVLAGPAPRPLSRYAVCEQADGTTLIDTSRPL